MACRGSYMEHHGRNHSDRSMIALITRPTNTKRPSIGIHLEISIGGRPNLWVRKLSSQEQRTCKTFLAEPPTEPTPTASNVGFGLLPLFASRSFTKYTCGHSDRSAGLAPSPRRRRPATACIIIFPDGLFPISAIDTIALFRRMV